MTTNNSLKKHHFGFALAGSLLTILFLAAVNGLTSSGYLWFLYPSYVLLLWPLGVLMLNRPHRLQVIFGSIVAIVFILTTNYAHSPDYPWFIYAVFPFILMAAAAWMGRRAGSFAFACFGSLATIVYYGVLNLFVSPQYPWIIYPAFAVLWWPLALYYARSRRYLGLSIAGCVLIVVFFAAVNAVSTPDTVWAIYPIFCVLWWPLCMYYYGLHQRYRESIRKG